MTRIAPSPTGYLHLGVFFTSMVNRLTADASNGLFYFRLEDTDKKREVEGGAADILAGLNAYGLTIDEGFVAPGEVKGAYGPYKQSERGSIYQAYVKKLVQEGLAYPCFCSPEHLAEVRDRQEQAKQRTGYYGPFASCRDLSPEEAIEKIEAGTPYVVRLRAPAIRTAGSNSTISSRAGSRCRKTTKILSCSNPTGSPPIISPMRWTII